MPQAPKTQIKQYRRRIPADWWLKHPSYTQFMVRELGTGVLAAYAIFLLVLLAQAKDAGSFQAFVAGLRSPLSIVLHLLVLACALFNSITTFNIAPRVLALRQGEEKVPDHLVAGVHYAAWAVASIVLLAIALTVRG
jgi:fumarate reductase subunit C